MEKYTDQEFFYKQTPVNYDGIAKFTSIKGNTLGWNQLVQNGNFADTSIWSTTGASSSFTVSNNIATVTAGGAYDRIQQNVQFISGHKYLIKADVKKTNANDDIRLYYGTHLGAGSYAFANTTEWQTLSVIRTASESVTSVYPNVEGTTSNLTWQQRNMMIFDLTQMGLDISSTSDFTSLFPLSYYSYNQGSLLSFNGTGLKTGGKNLIDFSNLQIGKNWTKGSAVDRAIIEFAVEGNKEYTISFDYSSNISNAILVFRTGWNTDQIGNSDIGSAKEYTFTAPSTCKVVCIQFNARVNGFVLSSSDFYGFWNCALTDTFSTKALPVSTYFPTGMKSTGNVYDELTESKAITRVGAVDLGTLSWVLETSATGSNVFFGGNTIPLARPSSSSKANVVCGRYTTELSDSVYSGAVDKAVGVSTSGAIRIRDTSFSDATTFKQSLSGVYLYYELATETETDAEDIFYKFYADGTEQLLPVNGSTPTTSYLIADIEYYDSTEGDSLYRRFWLINGDGERWDLTDKEFRSFLNNPTGLGFRKTIEVTRYGEKANKNNEVYDFPQPSGELLFYDTYNSTRYDKYNKFIRFLMSQPITLYYMIPVSYISGIANIFTLNCDVTEVQKTESKTDHILTSSIVFNGLGFYEGDEISVNGTTDTYTLTNEGDFPVGFEITIEGSLTNPYVTLSQDGELYGEAKFVGTDAYNSLYLNSNDGEQNVILQQGGSVIPNPLSYQDLSISNGSIYVTFVKLAKGVSELSIGVESGTISSVNIKYSPKYRSV